MRKVSSFFELRNLVVLSIFAIVLWGCASSGGNGELIGVQGRYKSLPTTPFGMTFVPQGAFVRGVGDQDPAYLSFNPKMVSISAFYIDETEITNNEYRQFVNYVKDSITRRLLGDALPDDFLIEDPNDPDIPSRINWKTKIKNTPEIREAMESLYIPVDERYYNRRDIDVRKLNFEYYTFDHQKAALKDFQAQDNNNQNRDIYYGSFVNRPQSLSSRKPFIQKHVVNVYPDTLCWIFDFAYSYNEPMTRSYFSNAFYDNYPVVGVNWKQAEAFTIWRSNLYTNGMATANKPTPEFFRLPTEAEWEYAARGGLDFNAYPYGGPYARNENGCLLGNFKPGRGDYTADGSIHTSIVGHFAPNDWGIYDMQGNVSEWCIDAYEESYLGLHDMNPTFKYNADNETEMGRKRKVIKGGSFKDFAEFTKTYARAYEYQDTCKSYIGFRCVQSVLGSGPTGSKSNIY